jgi:siroheme synthase-like protein
MEHGAALPVQLDVRGRRCVVVGAGSVGARRAATLVAAGADVVAVAPEAVASLAAAAAEGSLRWEQRQFAPDDLDDAFLAVAASGVAAVDEAVSAAASERGVLVNRADRAERGDLAFPAVVRRGPLRVAVSTGAAAPSVTRLVAELLDEHLDQVLGMGADDLQALVDVVAEVRTQLGATGVTQGPLDWRSALDGSILDLIRQGREAEAKERLLACLSSS